jgi:hypothetical protein
MKLNIQRQRERLVKRVLVMLDYGDGDGDSGEVFDLTELAKELRIKDEKFRSSEITMRVGASNDYDRRVEGNAWDRGYEPKTCIRWSVMTAFHTSGESGWLDDAVNASLPTSQVTEGLLKRVSTAEKNLEKLREAVKHQRLNEAAEVRLKYPVARISEAPLKAMLPEVAKAGNDGITG